MGLVLGIGPWAFQNKFWASGLGVLHFPHARLRNDFTRFGIAFGVSCDYQTLPVLSSIEF